MRVVVDTNILISGLLWDGNESEILKLCKTGEITLIISPDIIIELESVLSRKKFGLTKTEIDSAIGEILSISKIVNPRAIIDIIKEDPDDNIILECAIEGNAELIISGNKHLFNLKEFMKIPIVRSIEALKRIRKK